MSLVIGKFQLKVIESVTVHPVWLLGGTQGNSNVQTNTGQWCEEPAHTKHADAQTQIQPS